MSRLIRALSCLALLCVSASPASTTQSVKGGGKKPPELFINLTGFPHSLSGVSCDTYEWAVKDVKEMKIRLYVISKGERRVAQTFSYNWDRWHWPEWAAPLRFQALIVAQRGDPFGVKDMLRVSLSVTPALNTGAPWDNFAKDSDGEPAMIRGNFGTTDSGVHWGTVAAGTEREIYVLPLGPPGKTRWSNPQLGEMTKESATMPEKVFVAVTVEWTSFD